MRKYTARIFFTDGSQMGFDCDKMAINANGDRYYYAERDGEVVMTAPLANAKYTLLIQNWRNKENE